MNAAPPQRLEEAFFTENREVRIAGSKIACMLVVILMPAGSTLDYFVYREQTGFFFVLRLVCSALAFGLWLLLSTPFGRRYYRILGMGWLLLPNIFISLMIYFMEGVRSPYYAGLNLVLIAGSWVAQIHFHETIAAVLLTMFMYGAACVAHGGGTVSEYFSNYYFIVLTGIIVVTGSHYLTRLRFREYALRSELKEHQQVLQETNAKLVELDRAKSSFFANVSHELRTPLTLLIGPLERLRHGHPPLALHERSELLDIMHNNAMRLLRLINDLLDLVRLDSGVLRIRRAKLALIPFLEGISNSVSHMAQQRNLKFISRITGDADTPVFIDSDKIEKIILNLLFNSFKFTPEGGKVEMEAGLDGKWLNVTIRDTGKGIAAADLPRIFDRFWQAEASATRNYQGVGIGLALVKELAEAHGGSVSVESEVGKGTAIHVIVDASHQDESPIETTEEPTETQPVTPEWLTQLYRRAELFPAHVIAGGEAARPTPAASNGKPLVLLADDEPEMRRFLVSQLSPTYNVLDARNGSEALDFATQHDFQLILLDMMMPGIDGITLTRQLRENPRTAAVPIIILTARADEASKMQALEAGVTDFLTKPFASSELAARCRNLFSQNQLQLSLARKTRELEAALEKIKETETQLVHQAKMASLGQLSSGLMHEINNPLNFANTASHILQKRLQKLPDDARESLAAPIKDLQDGIRRVADIISGLRSFIHPDTSDFREICLREAVDASARFVQIPPSEITLEIDVPDDLKVWANRNQLIHLFINLLQNSADSLREKGAPEKKIKIDASLQNSHVVVRCEDNGKGVRTEDREKVFDAFYTTKPVGSGMGLGLNISYRIIRNHLGEITLDSEENQYCRFNITLHQTKPTT